MQSSKSFTLTELLIATTIILITSLAVLFSYIQCMELNSINKNTSTALQKARNMLETIKSGSFDQIYETHNNKTFPLDEINGIGLVEIDNTNPLLLSVSIKCFWKQPKGRVMGEDLNLNGILDKEEDLNKNEKLDSPINLLTYIAKR